MENNDKVIENTMVEFFNKNDLLMNLSLSLFVKYWISSLHRESRIIDCGCGMGYLLKKIKDYGFSNLSGLEINSEMAGIANKNTSCEIVTMDVLQIGEKISANTCDLLIFSDVLHHIPDSDKWLLLFKECWKVLKPNGRIIVRDPYPTLVSKLLVWMSKRSMFYVGPLESRLAGIKEEREYFRYFFNEWPLKYHGIFANAGFVIEREYLGIFRKIITVRKILAHRGCFERKNIVLRRLIDKQDIE